MTEIERTEMKIDMDLVLAALPDTHRRAALLFMRGYTQEEVAKELGVSQSSVSKWIGQMRIKMREYCQ